MRKSFVWPVVMVVVLGFVAWAVADQGLMKATFVEPTVTHSGDLGQPVITPMDRGGTNILTAPDETLGCDNGVPTQPGANGDPTWKEAVQLFAANGCALVGLLFWPENPESLNPALTWGVWDDDGPSNAPNTQLDAGTTAPTYGGWFFVPTSDTIPVPVGAYVYGGWSDENADPFYWNAFDDALDSCNWWFDGGSWVRDVFFAGDFLVRGVCAPLGVDEEFIIGPAGRVIALTQNRPNPFSHQTEIGYVIPARTKVSLKVYDLAGRLVRTLVDREMRAGVDVASWDGRDENGTHVSSGVYLYNLRAGESSLTRKLTLIH